MGAWGAGSFDNDDAGDWTWELGELGLEAIEAAFDIPPHAGYLEAPEASCAIAAAEVVAALRGHPARDLPDEVKAFLAEKPAVSDDLVTRARAVVARVLGDDSELRELWEESDSFDEWKEIVADLQSRLERQSD